MRSCETAARYMTRWAVVDGEDDALNDLELKKIDDLTKTGCSIASH